MGKSVNNLGIRRMTFLSISLNLFLFFTKLFLASLVNSVALFSDAFNHFSDSLSGFIFWIGQRLSNRKADANHPYGHGRGEYLTSLSIAMIMMVVSIQFFIESISRISSTTEVEQSPAIVLTLLIGIVIKIGLFIYAKGLFNKTKLLSTKALAIDNLFDVLISTLVLLSFLLQPLFHFSVDGVAGLVIALLIGWSAWQILLQSVRRVLGESLPLHEITEIRSFLKQYPDVLGSHLYMFHDYGPNYQTLSFHLEVAATQSFIKMHDLVDAIEESIKSKFGYDVTIHLDPMMTNQEEIRLLTEPIWKVLHQKQLHASIKDIRIIQEKLHQEMIVVLDDVKARDNIKSELEKHFPQYRFVMDW